MTYDTHKEKKLADMQFSEKEVRLGRAIGRILERKYEEAAHPEYKYECRNCGRTMERDLDFCDRCEATEREEE